MIRALIIDDEQHCIDRLASLLMPSHEKMVEIVGTAQSVEEGIKAVALFEPDLIFLDVQINDKTGFDLLRSLPEINFEIIFTTAYEKFAIQAIKFSAIDYLLKPIDEEGLSISINKLSGRISKKISAAKMNTLLQNLERKNAPFKKLIVPTNTGFELLEVSDIIHCESHINYTSIFLRENKKMVVAKTLKEFEEMLSEHQFFRIHNSHLINLACVKSYHKGKGGYVTLLDGTEIEVSTRRKDDFLKELAQL